MCLFWTRPSTKDVDKFIENFNLSPEKNQHQGNNIFGPCVDFESNNKRSSHESRHSIISTAEYELYIIDIKKSILHPCQKTEFVGMKIDSIKMTFSLTPDQKRYKTLSKLARTF